MAQKVQMTVRLDPAWYQTLQRFCDSTRRQEPDLVRHVLELFFAEGPEVAEARLTKGLWDLKGAARAELEAALAAARKRGR